MTPYAPDLVACLTLTSEHEPPQARTPEQRYLPGVLELRQDHPADCYQDAPLFADTDRAR